METSILDPQVAPELAVAEMPQCNHQWMIDSPNGPQSRGECRLCGSGAVLPELHRGFQLGIQRYTRPASWRQQPAPD